METAAAGGEAGPQAPGFPVAADSADLERLRELQRIVSLPPAADVVKKSHLLLLSRQRAALPLGIQQDPTAPLDMTESQSQEAEQNYETLTQQLHKLASRIHSEALRAKRAEAAMEALEEAGPQCVAYRQISRLFVLTPPKQLEKQLTQERQQVQQKELPKLEALKGQLVTRLRSIVAQRNEARKEYEAIVLKHYPQAAGSEAYAAAAARTAAAARAAEERDGSAE